jgi:hypothetical protein
MKKIAGWLGVALLAFAAVGCDDAATTAATTPTPDGRPAGFEDMMRGMEKDMKKATSPKGGARHGAPAKAK